MKHLINIVVFIFLWSMGYIFGDGVIDTYQDIIAIVCYCLGLIWLAVRYG